VKVLQFARERRKGCRRSVGIGERDGDANLRRETFFITESWLAFVSKHAFMFTEGWDLDEEDPFPDGGSRQGGREEGRGMVHA
jgi:hypothetical protein